MTLDEIIGIADEAYADGLVAEAADGGACGATLALFIACELKDTYNPETTDAEQLWEAHLVINSARSQLQDVEEAFEELAVRAQEKEEHGEAQP